MGAATSDETRTSAARPNAAAQSVTTPTTEGGRGFRPSDESSRAAPGPAQSDRLHEDEQQIDGRRRPAEPAEGVLRWDAQPLRHARRTSLRITEETAEDGGAPLLAADGRNAGPRSDRAGHRRDEGEGESGQPQTVAIGGGCAPQERRARPGQRHQEGRLPKGVGHEGQHCAFKARHSSLPSASRRARRGARSPSGVNCRVSMRLITRSSGEPSNRRRTRSPTVSRIAASRVSVAA